MAAAPRIVSDDLWELIEPLLPKKKRRFRLLLARLRAAGEIEWARAIVDSSKGAGENRGSATGPSPVDRGRPGSKHQLLVHQSGLPLAFALTGSNRNDVTQLIPLLDAVPVVVALLVGLAVDQTA